ncbi:BglII/BstYI family type II restriction endonuclease [Donghicola mangrovi]|uniref:BglII/BstYI family type II restriction endonuclease n=1 Tax=Donghicola mangrovi TaxID=2729614 RepID=UPI001D149B49|nr:BglII/BstYI family type II restriction endonuclease [Donghicola mangrovi]
MILTKTYDDPTILPPTARNAWTFLETNSASAIMKAVCPTEWAEVVDILSTYRLNPSTWLRKGGNRGHVPKEIDKEFAKRGWKEARLDLETTTLIQDKGKNSKPTSLPPLHQEGYFVDNYKNRIVLDVEWAAKDGNLDRDLAAYRSWHEAGAINAGIIITRDREDLFKLANHLWTNYQMGLPPAQRQAKFKLPVDLHTTTTTALDKAELRVRRGVMGTCPILIVAANRSTWNGKPYI